MLRSVYYILLFSLCSAHFSNIRGQMLMPDYVCRGETRHYFVESTPGSVYIWRIDGIIQKDQSASEFVYTWNNVRTFLLEVQEMSAYGCLGPVRSGIVEVGAAGRDGLIIRDAFSPNGDLVNDVWNIGNIDLYPEIEVSVWNRWGQLVWKSGRGYPVPWDGRYKGSSLPIDSYHYIIDLHNGTRPVSGTVTIVR